MKCPVCNVELRMTERQGVEIDYCPQCRGVWLDRGELDRMIERSASREFSEERRVADPEKEERRVADPEKEERRVGYPEKSEDRGPKKRKRESFLGDLFDFG
ncbi:MAG: zf-TFIIB domain-containing protein [Dehalococcoidia bacterium]|nr:hypothetical protein [Chloroflexota bacterium]